MLAIKQLYKGKDLAQVSKNIQDKAMKASGVFGLADVNQFDEISAQFAYAQEVLADKQKQLRKLARKILKAQKEREEMITHDEEFMVGYRKLFDKVCSLSMEEGVEMIGYYYTLRPGKKFKKSPKVVEVIDEEEIQLKKFTTKDFLAATATAAVTSVIATGLYKCFF